MGSKRNRNKIEHSKIPNIDEIFEIDQTWEETDQVYRAVASCIVEIGNNFNLAIQTINSRGYETTNELIITTNGITQDLMLFTEDLVKINQRHAGYSGMIKNEDELALCLSVFNDYVMLNDRFRAVVFPAMLTITEYLTESSIAASDAMKEGTN